MKQKRKAFVLFFCQIRTLKRNYTKKPQQNIYSKKKKKKKKQLKISKI